MRLMSKKEIKNAFAYSWPFYIIVGVISVIAWSWAFGVYHAATPFEKINIFIGTEVKDSSFTYKIKEQLENVKSVTYSSSLPNDNTFAQKLALVGMEGSDILILDKSSTDKFVTPTINKYFLAIDEEINSAYFSNQSTSFVVEEKTYGYSIKDSWITNYIGLNSQEEYYLFINASSKNIGKYYKNDNKSVSAFIASSYLLNNHD